MLNYKLHKFIDIQYNILLTFRQPLLPPLKRLSSRCRCGTQ